ncbi:hypothetical protein LEP1GSC052_0638 [Leptospira kmetyi serovar Malaysia str. Bejo-Iso9]|nr:hypothetical protein LEP1GSC052_0638 [Leptospira kmetyi serovar Malaysia str. Bejo-Iso9]
MRLNKPGCKIGSTVSVIRKGSFNDRCFVFKKFDSKFPSLFLRKGSGI